MSNDREVQQQADRFAALGSEPRLRIVRLLLTCFPQGLIVGQIQSELGIASSTLSHHLEKLKNEDLVRATREGTAWRYFANADAFKAMLDFLMAECCTRNQVIEPPRSPHPAAERKRKPMQEPACCSPSCCPENQNQNEIIRTQAVVQEKYGALARQVSQGSAGGGCCGGAAQALGADAICENLYQDQELSGLPEEAVLASLGCGNPTALARLEAGQVVLDLGSGGGIDVLLSAKRVGPSGKAYGLDMTEDMLELARANQRRAGVSNVEFLKGEIEKIPLPANTVDVIISNCVINLSADKDQVLREAFRVLKPGGLLAVSDVVTRGEVPLEVRRNVELWIGCVAGALHEDEYTHKLKAAGFTEVSIEPTRVYSAEDARGLMQASGCSLEPAVLEAVDGKFFSGFIRGRKPGVS